LLHNLSVSIAAFFHERQARIKEDLMHERHVEVESSSHTHIPNIMHKMSCKFVSH